MASSSSPRFAIDAERLLREGRPLEALDICERGIEAHPEYPAGYLLLSRARVASGNHAGALQALQAGMMRMPHVEVFQHLIDELAAHTAAAKTVRGETATLEALAKNLEGATIPPVAGETNQPEHPPIATMMVTPTLAGIYEQQGLFDAAIKTYTTLAATQKSRRKEFENKIEELKVRRAAQEPPGADR
jgi:tetratricopeptide (TPR) repeat protein